MDSHACPQVPTPPIEQLTTVLMYEWMRTHSIAIEHWIEAHSSGTSWFKHLHLEQFEHYMDIAAYCQTRVFLMNDWPLNHPYFTLPDPRKENANTYYAVRSDWVSAQFDNGLISLNPEWLKQHPDPAFKDSFCTPSRKRILNAEQHSYR